MSKKMAVINSALKMLPLACLSVFVAVLSMILFPVLVNAFEIPTGTEDVKIRLDTTLRYSYANRVAGQNSQILNNPNTDDGNRNFSHATVGNRIDLLPELDVVYLRNYGLRVSGAFWYDFAYAESFTNNSNGTSNHLENGVPVAGRLNDRAKREYRGPYGEFMDAFVFGRFDIGEVPVNVRVGRHTVYWGESLLIGGALHGISYGQSPIDVSRGLMLPGAEVKELFRPLNQVSIQIQPTNELTIKGQYFMEWDSFRYPEAGTYLGFLDPLQKSGESLIVGPGQRALRGSNSEPDAFRNWGVAVNYSPDWLNGTVGLYYRKFADMQPQLAVSPSVAVLPAAVGDALGYTRLEAPGVTPAPYAFSPASIPDIAAGRVGKYYLTYGQDIDLVGISFSKQVLGISVGAEFAYRWNMPLVSSPVMILPAPLASGVPGAISYVPTDGQTAGARGETMHAVVNLLGVTGQTALFNNLTWMTEFTWNRLSNITQNAAAFKAGSSGYTGVDAATKDFFGAAVQVTPTWYKVLTGVDLTMPLSYSRGLSGVSSITGGGARNAGTWSAGVGFDYLERYKFDLKYINFFGQIGSDGTPSDATTAGLKDRDMVTFTFSTKF